METSNESPTSSTTTRKRSDSKLVRTTTFVPEVAPEGVWFWIPILWQRSSKGGLRLQVRWRHLFGCLLASAFAVWFGGASGAYFFVKYKRGFSEVEFTHMLLYPWREADYREARGRFWIAQGKKKLQDGELREAFYDLRMGLKHAPSDMDARLLLAQFYVMWQRAELAQTVLLEGLDFHGSDQDYLRTLLSFLLERQEDGVVLAITEEWLRRAPTEGPAEDLRTMTALARATAQFFRGNLDAAEETILLHKLDQLPDGKIMLLRVEWERGGRDVALERLQALTEEIPENEEVYAQYAAYLRETGRDDELRRSCLLRRIAYPEQSRPRIDLLYLHSKAGDETAVQAGLVELRSEFPRDPDVMMALGDFAANTGRPELAREIYEHCKANKLPWEGPALMSVEAFLVAGRYVEALEAVRSVMEENVEWGRRMLPIFNGLQAIAHYGLKDKESAQLFLEGFLEKAVVRADNLVAVSNRLVAVGAAAQARQVLARAVSLDPLNQAALAGLIRLDVQLDRADRMPPHVARLLTMRKPPRDLLAEAFDLLARDREMFAEGRAKLLDELERVIGVSNKL